MGSASLSQTVTVNGPGTFEFGAFFSFASVPPYSGNTALGQISLTVLGGSGPSVIVGRTPAALDGQFTIQGGLGFFFTRWLELSGTLTYAGLDPADLLLEIRVKDATAGNRLVLDVDNVYLRPVGVPEPATSVLLAAALAALAAIRRSARRS